MSDLDCQRFAEACGAVGPLVLQHEQDGIILPVQVDRPYVIVGRDPNADVILDEPAAMGRHAYLQILGGRLLCVNLRRLSNAHPPESPRRTWLDVGKSLQLGPAKVRLISGVCANAPANEQQLPSVTIEEPGGVTWNLCRPLSLIGSASDCEVRVSGPRVSRYQTALVTVPDGVWVVDLLCRKKSSAKPAVVAIRRGQRVGLRVGDVVLELRVQNPAAGNTNGLAVQEARIKPTESTGMASTVTTEQFLQLQKQMFAQFNETIVHVVSTLGALQREQLQLLQQEMAKIERLDRELAELRNEQARLSPGYVLPSRPAERPATVMPTPNAAPTAALPMGSNTPPTTDLPGPAANVDVHAWLGQRVAELTQERQGVWARVYSYLSNSPTSAAQRATEK